VPTPSGGTVTLNLAAGEHRSISQKSAGRCGVGADFKTQVGYSNGQGGSAGAAASLRERFLWVSAPRRAWRLHLRRDGRA
jgi:hypothetical protein